MKSNDYIAISYIYPDSEDGKKHGFKNGGWKLTAMTCEEVDYENRGEDIYHDEIMQKAWRARDVYGFYYTKEYTDELISFAESLKTPFFPWIHTAAKSIKEYMAYYFKIFC